MDEHRQDGWRVLRARQHVSGGVGRENTTVQTLLHGECLEIEEIYVRCSITKYNVQHAA